MVRQSNIELELQRLMCNPRIRSSLAKVESDFKFPLSLTQKVAYAHSLELREKLKETHYVINHGQNIEMIVVTKLATKIKERFESISYKGFEVLRHQVHTRHLNPQLHTSQWFSEQLTHSTDDKYRKELICGDIYLESTNRSESALDFLVRSIYNKWEFITPILKDIVSEYFSDSTTQNMLAEEIVEIGRNLGYGGTLHFICIPKESFADRSYLALPFGRPVANGKYTTHHLEQMQEGLSHAEVSDFPFEVVERRQIVPQVRILAHQLNPTQGVLVVPHSTLSQEKLDEIDQNINLAIQKAMIRFRVA